MTQEQIKKLEDENKGLRESLAAYMVKEQLSVIENYRYEILEALERINKTLEKIANGQTKA